MSEWLPPGIDLATGAFLVALSALTSSLTAALGAGGGLLMLAAMAALLPPFALIPAHGIVQLGSNGGRAWMARRHIGWELTALLLGGAVLGTLAGASLLRRLPAAWLQLAVAIFILWTVWAPRRAPRARGPLGIAAFGALSGFLSLFVGATGPLVSAWVQRQVPDRHIAIATMAACMTGLNLFKLAAFAYAGFRWSEWLPLCGAMIGGGLLGTWLGLSALSQLPEAHFRRIFRWLLSLLAANAAWRGVQLLLAAG